jgi:hypothetical protein
LIKEQKRVLIIGLVDSVHLGRWLTQFSEENIDFYIFASKRFRDIHPLIRELTEQDQQSKYEFLSPFKRKNFPGYIDFIYFEILGRVLNKFTRREFLSNLLKRNRFDYIHAIEFQGAGYLVDSIDLALINKQALIVTNWGSDIFYFRRILGHEDRIRGLLSKADFYSAECERDYNLAKIYGFTGKELPCIPVAGGFHLEVDRLGNVPTSLRKVILIKGYGGTFGRAEKIIQLIPNLLNRFSEFTIHIYSATDDVLKAIKLLPYEIRSKIKVTTSGDRITHAEMLSVFSHSRVHIGFSVSDGISTAFLESLCTGAYPIQTNTSCANEWVKLGVIASIVDLNQDRVLDQIILALTDNELVDRASKQNLKVAKQYLEYKVVQKKALEFYK